MRWIKTESGTTGMATSISAALFSVFARATFVLVSVSEKKRAAIHPSCWVRSSRIPVSLVLDQEDLPAGVETIDDRIVGGGNAIMMGVAREKLIALLIVIDLARAAKEGHDLGRRACGRRAVWIIDECDPKTRRRT